MKHSRECAKLYGEPCDCGARDESEPVNLIALGFLPFQIETVQMGATIPPEVATRSWCPVDLGRDAAERERRDGIETLKRMRL